MDHVVIGLILVAAGALLLLGRLGLTNLSLGEAIRTYWPLILVVWGLRVLSRRQWAWGTVLVALGAFWLGGNLGWYPAGAVWGTVLPVLIILLGLWLLLGLRWGASGGTIQLFGPLRAEPAGELGPLAYSAAFGDLHLDLSRATLAPGETPVQVSGAFGDTTVIVPPDAAVAVDYRLAFGNLVALGERREGLTLSGRVASADYGQAERRLRLQVTHVFGDVTVARRG